MRGITLLAAALLLLCAALQAEEITFEKKITQGVYTDRTGARHQWFINLGHTLIWDMKPYLPVGGMFCPPYTQDPSDAGWAMTTAQLDLLREKGVQDLYVNFAGPDNITADKLQKILDALDERSLRYGIEISNNPAPGPAWCVSAGPTVKTLASGPVRAECPGAKRALFVALDAKTNALIASGKAKVDGNQLEATLALQPGQTAEVRFTPERNTDPFFWDGHYEQYEKKIKSFYSQIKFGPGFRFVVDPFQNEMQVNPSQVPSTADYSKAFTAWLTKRYGTLEKLAAAWATPPAALASIADAAALVPVWPGDAKNPAALIHPETGALVRVDPARSQLWYDFLDFHGEQSRDYCNRIADAVKTVANVPVIFKHCGSIAPHRVNDANIPGGLDGIGMESYGTGETARIMNGIVCYAEAEQASKTTWLIATETAEAALNNQLENIGYTSRMAMLNQIASLMSAGAKGVFVFGLSFGAGASDGLFWKSEFLRDPRQLEWLGMIRKIIDNGYDLANYQPSVYYRFPVARPERLAFAPPERDFAGIDGDWTGANGGNLRNVQRARNGAYILPAFKADLPTNLMIANLERAPASTRWGAELSRVIASKFRVAYIGFRYDLGAVPALDKFFTNHFVVDSDGRQIQGLKPGPNSKVLARGSDGSIWNLIDGDLQIVSKEVPDKEGWHPEGLSLTPGTGTQSCGAFIENSLRCKLINSRSARAISFTENGVPTTYLSSLDQKDPLRLPVKGMKAPATVKYPDGADVPQDAEGKIAIPLEQTPALVETPAPYIRGKHAETRTPRDAVIYRVMGIFPPMELGDNGTAELEAEESTESNWGWGRFDGFPRLSGGAMWALSTFADPPKYSSYFLNYIFQWKTTEKKRLWVREANGMSPSRWRLNLGPWHELPSEMTDIDKQFIGPWTPFDDAPLNVAWHDYGQDTLLAGENIFEFQVLQKRPKGDKYCKLVDKLEFAPLAYRPLGKE